MNVTQVEKNVGKLAGGKNQLEVEVKVKVNVTQVEKNVGNLEEGQTSWK